MQNKNILYNVNTIMVEPGLECSYIDFSKDLNEYLLSKYSKYYAGLQLYQNNDSPNIFYVVASYKCVPGLFKIAPLIGNQISKIYDRVWGNTVERTSVFSFLTSTRII
ncbi:hypothetical protein ACQPU1_13100 [Clostridium paraputrificum]|uniref:hypothetical protein n=1 Tax=Clostridium TaxID=1485 RepID=UPI003D3437A3